MPQARQKGWQDSPATAKGLNATTLTPIGLSVPPSTALTLTQRRRVRHLIFGQVLLTTHGQHIFLLLQVLVNTAPAAGTAPYCTAPTAAATSFARGPAAGTALFSTAPAAWAVFPTQPLLLEQPHLAQALLLEQLPSA